MSRTWEEERDLARPQMRLADLCYLVVVISLLLADLAPALRSGKDQDWNATGLVFTLAGLLFCPVVLICAVVHYSPTSLSAERRAVAQVLKTFVIVLLVLILLVIQTR